MAKQNILLVGCGNMGFAMLKTWVQQKAFVKGDLIFHVVEPAEPLAERAQALGCQAYSTATSLDQGLPFDMVILAVKPQLMDQVVGHYKIYADQGACFLSIAAGTTLDQLKRGLGAKTPIIRTMPNTPAAIGKGMMVSCVSLEVTQGQKDLAHSLLQAGGKSAWIDDEQLMDAVTAISGSGPAYIFHFIESLAKAGESLGLEPELSTQLAIQTVYGAACLAKGSSTPAATLRVQVTSPGGTTAAALTHLMDTEKGLVPLMAVATKAARDRGKELAF